MKKLCPMLVSAILSMSLALTTGCGDDDDDGGTIDAASAADAAAGSIDANPNAPVASFTFTPNCTTDNTTAVEFTSTSTDPNSDTLTCSWSIGSGNPSTSTDCTVTGVTFPSAACYNVTLTVSDGTNSATATQQICPC